MAAARRTARVLRSSSPPQAARLGPNGRRVLLDARARRAALPLCGRVHGAHSRRDRDGDRDRLEQGRSRQRRQHAGALRLAQPGNVRAARFHRHARAGPGIRARDASNPEHRDVCQRVIDPRDELRRVYVGRSAGGCRSAARWDDRGVFLVPARARSHRGRQDVSRRSAPLAGERLSRRSRDRREGLERPRLLALPRQSDLPSSAVRAAVAERAVEEAARRCHRRVQGFAGDAMPDGDCEGARAARGDPLAARARYANGILRRRLAHRSRAPGCAGGVQRGDGRMSARLIACAFAVASVAPAARAQIAGAAYCSSAVYDGNVRAEGAGPIDRVHPLLSRGRYADDVRHEQWSIAVAGLRDDAVQAFAAARVAPEQQAIFLAQIDSVLGVLPRLPGPGAPSRTTFVADSVRTIRFLPVQGVDAFHLFRRPTIELSGLTANQSKALCWSAMSVDVVLFRLAKPLEGAALARLGRLNTSWANYRAYGYTRQPLELFLFRGSVHDSLPAKGQWLVGHLSVGGEISGRRADSLMTSTDAVVELGRLWYRSDFTQYAGLSAIAAFPARNSIAYGAMLHVARGMRGGILLRKSGDTWRKSFVMSTDLYGWLEQSKQAIESKLAVVRG